MAIKVEAFTKDQLDYIEENLFFKSSKEFQEEFNYDPSEFRIRLKMVIDSGGFISEEYKGESLQNIIKSERIKLMKRYQGQKTLEELSEMLGITDYQIRKIGRENGIKILGVKNHNTKEIEFTKEDTQYILKEFMYKSAKDIAHELERHTGDQVSSKIKELLKSGAFGENKKDMNLHEARMTLRIEFLSTLEDNVYHISEIVEMLDSSITTAVNLSEKAGLKLRRKKAHTDDTGRLSKIFYEIPTSEIDLNKTTYEEWFRRWFHTYRDTGIREVTRMSYYNVWTKISETSFGQMQLTKINRNHVQAYVNEYGKTRSKNTVLDHMQLIRSAFKDAQLDGHIKVNPAGNIRIAYKEQTLSMKEQKDLRDTKKWLEVDEYEKLKNYLVNKAVELLNSPPEKVHKNRHSKGVLLQTHIMIILTALKTGARYSEIMGLTRSDVIQVRPYRINIDKTWDHKKIDGETFVPTKNMSSIREVHIDEETTMLLDKYINWLDEYSLETEQDTLFNLVDKGIYNTDSNKVLRGILTELGIQPISMHKLRHTMASYLIAKGVDLMVVAKRLGHTDSSMVMKVYGHLLEETEDKHNERIMQLL